MAEEERWMTNELVANFSEKEFCKTKGACGEEMPCDGSAYGESPVHENWYVPALDRTGVAGP